MTLILLDAFTKVNEGPGLETMGTYTTEIVVMLLGAFIMGYLLRYFLGAKSTQDSSQHDLNLKKKIQAYENEIAQLKTKSYSVSGSGEAGAKEINDLKLELTKTKAALKTCEESKSASVQGFVAQSTAQVKKDDLKIVEGIGPKIEQLLQQGGIYSFEQLASSSPDKIREILLAAGERYRIHDPSTWPKQADYAAKGDITSLKTYQESLNGGKVE
jgi:predicted flap endonuclease-1-like 5' DNA nuclease